MAHRFSKAELDEQFEQFLKESLSDDSFENSKTKSTILETLGQPRRKELKKKDPVPWWISEDDSDDGGMLGTNGSFLKSQKDSHPTVEVDEEAHTGKMQLQRSDGVSVSLSRDSLEPDDSVVASGPNQSILGAGLDTLEEQEEKERFFAKLEKGGSYTIDYSRLNKELDSNDSVLLAAFSCNEQNVEQVEDESKREEKCGYYSEDFEDETESNYPSKNEDNQVEQTVRSDADLSIQGQDEKTGMLAKVCQPAQLSWFGAEWAGKLHWEKSWSSLLTPRSKREAETEKACSAAGGSAIRTCPTHMTDRKLCCLIHKTPPRKPKRSLNSKVQQ